MEADFSGYATKAGLKCSDGRTIMPNAFEHQDKVTVPLVWAHGHDDPDNVLGHVLLENRTDGVYAYGFFNNTPKGQSSKQLVEHGDVSWLSIYANQLVEKGKQVFHGAIREVSLVLAGANPGAKIDYVAIQHGDGDIVELDDEAVITTGLSLSHGDDTATTTEDELTLAEVYDSMSDQQKEAVHFMVSAALEANGTVEHSEDDDAAESEGDAESESDDDTTESEDAESDDNTESDDDAESDDDDTTESDDAQSDDDTEGDLNHQEGSTMSRNIFESNGEGGTATKRPTLSHDQLSTIVKDAKEVGFKASFLAHAEEYGINNINLMFPDASTVTNTPEMVQRRVEWVSKVLSGTKHSPFAKVKTLIADVTAEEARAKGYVTGNKKTEEVIQLLRRTTGPTTVYKKQKLDRDDLLDITEYDVVNWLWAEIVMMLEEELARAILVGDGRSALSEDKIKDPAGSIDGDGIRSILKDDDLYSIKVEMDANVSSKDAVKALVRARSKYRGTGKPTLFVSDNYLTDIMLEEDKFGRALYETEQALADKLRVSDIVTVDLFDEYDNLFGIMVSLVDYTIGSNKGGELTRFEDFDIDFNQYKYLLETRLSGGLTKPFSAIVINRATGTKATATAPSFNGTTNTITIPTATGVVYTIDDEVVTGSVVITETTEVNAEPAEGYYLESNSTRSWTYTP